MASSAPSYPSPSDTTSPISFPETHITDSNTNTSTPSPLHSQWQKADQTLFSWLNATLTEPIFSQVYHLRSSSEVWAALEANFASHNTANIVQLQNTLNTIRKDNLSITDYLHKIKIAVDVLATVDKSLFDLDLISNTLRGLGLDYESFITAIYTRPVLPTFHELHALLLHHKARLEYQMHHQHILPQSSVPFARTQSANNSNQQRSSSGYHGSRGSTNGGGGRGDRNGNGRGRENTAMFPLLAINVSIITSIQMNFYNPL
ncbi:hypothetical protein BVC80_9035g5 [Macleaya cordata]|uniref:Retrotransposon gag domain-containing protein n=1 Tax=Macleaya cordata TaxID=56857 RepID=A0A200QYI9_MACCD|nr:hypothetical protein BVC80_9035g5 [Macleaya cordata]